MSHEEAVADFKKRIKQYEDVYETIEPFEWEGMDWEQHQRRDTGGTSKGGEQEDRVPHVTDEREKERLRLVEEAAKHAGRENEKRALVTRQMAKHVSYMKVINVGKQVSCSEQTVLRT